MAREENDVDGVNDSNRNNDNNKIQYVMGISEAAVGGTAVISVLGTSDVSLQHAYSVSGTSGYG